MSPSDLIVLCALGLPMREARDLLVWYVSADPVVVLDASIQWWVHGHAKIVAEYLAEEYRNKYRRY